MKRSFLPLRAYIAAALGVAAMYGASLATAQTPAFKPAELPTPITGVVLGLAHTDLAAQANLQFYPLDDSADLQT